MSIDTNVRRVLEEHLGLIRSIALSQPRDEQLDDVIYLADHALSVLRDKSVKRLPDHRYHHRPDARPRKRRGKCDSCGRTDLSIIHCIHECHEGWFCSACRGTQMKKESENGDSRCTQP